MTNLQVHLQKQIDDSYEIEFTQESGKVLSNFLVEQGKKRVLVVTDDTIFPLHYKELTSQIDSNIDVEILILQAGEKYKNMDTVLMICQRLIDLGYNRNDYVVAFGGGVIGDIVGFAAGIYKRGTNVIQIPTTLLSMFDSSVGGKTGGNLGGIKNIIGRFWQPKKVFINPKYLSTLPQKEIHNGYFEGLKHSLLDSRGYYNEFKIQGNVFLEEVEVFGRNISTEQLNSIIARNIEVKVYHVEKDETENGIRKFLNYGHTFGHAIELMIDFSIPHGVCVAFGIIYENMVSNKLGYLSDEDMLDINTFTKEKIGKECQNLVFQTMNFDEIYAKMKKDKKNIDSSISFALVDEPGTLHEENIEDDKKELLQKCFEEFRGFIQILQ